MDHDNFQDLVAAVGARQRQEQISQIRELKNVIQQQEEAKASEKLKQDRLYELKTDCHKISELLNNADHANAYALMLKCSESLKDFTHADFSTIEFKELYRSTDKYLSDILSWAQRCIPANVIIATEERRSKEKHEQKLSRLRSIRDKEAKMLNALKGETRIVGVCSVLLGFLPFLGLLGSMALILVFFVLRSDHAKILYKPLGISFAISLLAQVCMWFLFVK